MPSRFISVGLATGVKAALPYTSGVLLITDISNNTSAIFSLNDTANTTTLLSANSATFSSTLGNTGTCNIAWDAAATPIPAYVIENKLVGLTVQIVADTLLVGAAN